MSFFRSLFDPTQPLDVGRVMIVLPLVLLLLAGLAFAAVAVTLRLTAPPPTPVPVVVGTQTLTPSLTREPGLPPLWTQTFTASPSGTATVTFTGTITSSPSISSTPSRTGTITPTRTRTRTKTWVYTTTRLNTYTSYPSRTRTPTWTTIPTRTLTPTVTNTGTVTATATLTLTPSPSATITSSLTETLTQTITETLTLTLPLTETTTATETSTVTETETPASTSTETATMTMTSTATGTPTPVVIPPLIAFSADCNSDGFLDICAMLTDGTSINTVLAGASVDLNIGNWSPDGTQLVYEISGTLHTVLSNGSGDAMISNLPAGTNTQPAWSPDGQWIVFVNFNTQSDLYRIHSDGSGLEQLTNDVNTESDPSWTRDSSAVYFTESGDIYRMNLGTLVKIDIIPSGTDASPHLSPDGLTLVFARNSGGPTGWDIYMADAIGGNITPFYTNAANETEPSWSSDGSNVVYLQSSQIAVSGSVLGGGPSPELHPAWSP